MILIRTLMFVCVSLAVLGSDVDKTALRNSGLGH